MRAGNRGKARIALFAFCAVTFVSMFFAWLVQTDFCRLKVSNVKYRNESGAIVRAKLFRPRDASQDKGMPGVVFVHGYQSTRESSDPYCIELARRGFVVLNIDALGRGNSGLPGREQDPGFDDTYGATASYHYLRNLAFVDSSRIGLIGHSLGGQMMYEVALREPDARALVLIGAAYDNRASFRAPQNMLMIFGKWDEFRMT